MTLPKKRNEWFLQRVECNFRTSNKQRRICNECQATSEKLHLGKALWGEAATGGVL